MHKSLLLTLFYLVFWHLPHAQVKTNNINKTNNTFEYYISLSGIETSSDVEKFQTKIEKKSGVLFFMGNRYPVRYFMLRSSREISLMELKTWISPYDLQFFGEGEKGHEEVVMRYNKIKKALP